MRSVCSWCREFDFSVQRRQTDGGLSPALCMPCYLDAKKLAQDVVVPIELVRFSPRSLEVLANA